MTETINQEEVGERIRRIRQGLNLTQQKMADHLHLSANYYAMIERGERGASLNVLSKVARLAGQSIDELVYGLECDEKANMDAYLSISQEFRPREVADALKFARTYLELEKK